MTEDLLKVLQEHPANSTAVPSRQLCVDFGFPVTEIHFQRVQERRTRERRVENGVGRRVGEQRYN